MDSKNTSQVGGWGMSDNGGWQNVEATWPKTLNVSCFIYSSTSRKPCFAYVQHSHIFPWNIHNVHCRVIILIIKIANRTDLIPCPGFPAEGGARCTALIFLKGWVNIHHIKLTFQLIQIKHVQVTLKIPENSKELEWLIHQGAEK